MYRSIKEIKEDFITSTDVLSVNKEILGYKSEMDSMCGSIYWSKSEDDELILYATPNWDDDWGIVPFDGLDGDHIGKLDFTKSKYVGNKSLQLELYFEAVEIAIQKLEKKYKKINKVVSN